MTDLRKLEDAVTYLKREPLTSMELNAKLQQKKNAARKLLHKKGVVARDKTNQFDNYKYFSEAGYKKLFTELFSTVGLEITSNIVEIERFTVEGKQNNGRLVMVEFQLSDVETGFSETSTFYGEGFDKGDKGIYKAYTGALKYYLANTFMVATGDDPETESPEGTEKETFINPEMETRNYRRFIDNYFAQYPNQLPTFLKKYKIKALDELDNKVTLKKIDTILTGMKAELSKAEQTGVYSQEETF